MAYTVGDAVGRFRKRFGDVSTSEAIQLLNEAAQEILFRIPYQRRQIEVNLVAGTREYILDGGYLKVWAASYAEAAGEEHTRRLASTSTDELDAEIPGWRTVPASTPSAYYVTGNALLGAGAVGLYPTPNLSTAGGYPKLLLDVSTTTVYDGLDDTLPNVPLVLDAFVDLMCFKRAKDAKVADAATWKALSEESLVRASEMFWGRNPRTPETIVPVVRQRRNWRPGR